MMTIRGPWCLGVLPALLGVLTLQGIPAAAAAEPVRVAILVSGEVDQAARDAEALLSIAVLGDDPRVQPVERGLLDALLAEQARFRLADLGGAKAVRDRVRLGRLLDADLLLILSSDEQEGVVRVVASETGMGLRLERAALKMDNPKAMAVRGRRLLDRVLRLHSEPIREIVAIPPFASDDLTFTHDADRRAFAELAATTARRLPGVITVELEEAQAIGRELTIRGQRGLERPLPLYLHGRYATGPDQDVAITLRLDRGERQIAHHELGAQRRSAAVVAMTSVVHQLLARQGEAGEPPRIDPVLEAKQLFKRAQDAHRLGYYSDAADLAQAAVLLQPDDQRMRRLVIQSLADAYKKDRVLSGLEEARARWLVQARAMLPEVERNLIENKIDLGLVSAYLAIGDQLEVAQMVVRVMRHKSEHKPHEKTHELLRYVIELTDRQSHRELMTPEQKLAIVRQAAEYWPDLPSRRTDTSRSVKALIHLHVLISIRPEDHQVDEALMREHLDELAEVGGPYARTAALEMKANLDQGLKINGVSREPKPKPKPKPEPEPTDYRAEMRYIKLPFSLTSGWLRTLPGIDVAWANKRDRGGRTKNAELWKITADAEPVLIAEIVPYNRGGVCFDGKYVWAVLAGEGKPRVLAYDVASGQRRTFTAEHGLPDAEIDFFAVGSATPGQALAVAMISSGGVARTWIGMLQIEPEGLRVDVVFVARDNAGESINRAFRPSWAQGFPGAGPDGAPRFILGAYRSQLVYDPGAEPAFRRFKLKKGSTKHEDSAEGVVWSGPQVYYGTYYRSLYRLDPTGLKAHKIRVDVPGDTSLVGKQLIMTCDFHKGIAVARLDDPGGPFVEIPTRPLRPDIYGFRGRLKLSHVYGVVFLDDLGGVRQLRIDGEPVDLLTDEGPAILPDPDPTARFDTTPASPVEPR
ncbi:MAG: hypothetical protein AAF750_08840 [Planctomycetota bacterium]